MFNNIAQDKITKVEIDDSGRLHLKPEKSKFTLIYRTATEVHWDDKKNDTLFSQTKGLELLRLVSAYYRSCQN